MTPARDTREEWTQDGGFFGSDGRWVRCYDDVILSRPIPVESAVRTNVAEVPAGTICTVLFYSKGPAAKAELECCVGENAFAFGYEEVSALKLFATYEEKNSR